MPAHIHNHPQTYQQACNYKSVIIPTLGKPVDNFWSFPNNCPARSCLPRPPSCNRNQTCRLQHFRLPLARDAGGFACCVPAVFCQSSFTGWERVSAQLSCLTFALRLTSFAPANLHLEKSSPMRSGNHPCCTRQVWFPLSEISQLGYAPY